MQTQRRRQAQSQKLCVRACARACAAIKPVASSAPSPPRCIQRTATMIQARRVARTNGGRVWRAVGSVVVSRARVTSCQQASKFFFPFCFSPVSTAVPLQRFTFTLTPKFGSDDCRRRTARSGRLPPQRRLSARRTRLGDSRVCQTREATCRRRGTPARDGDQRRTQ